MKLIYLLWLSLLLCTTLPAHAQKPELVVPIGHASNLNCAALSPDGRYVLSGGWDNALIL